MDVDVIAEFVAVLGDGLDHTRSQRYTRISIDLMRFSQ